MYYYENQAIQKGFRFVVGIDEAGRGPLAGPVVASAVLLKERKFKNKISDSKQMTPQERESAFHEIFEKAYIGIGIMNENIIDADNILQATFHAMNQAISDLIYRLPLEERSRETFPREMHLLIDGNIFRNEHPFSYQTIVDGDCRCRSVACASIIAKVIRDRILTVYDRIYPQYGFRQHKGYSTESHRQAIKDHGLSRIHRRSFRMNGESVDERID